MDLMKIKESLSEFSRILLGSSAGKYIAGIIHFGSTSSGGFDDSSDVDVMVISLDGDEVRDAVADAAFTVQMNHQIGLEPVVTLLDDLITITDYFHYSVLRNGREVFKMDPVELKRQTINHMVSLAKEYLDGARASFESGFARLAVDAGYNAAELAVKGLLLAKREELPGSHGGIVGAFGEEYVKNGLFPSDLGRKLNIALELRNSARYKFQAVINEKDVKMVLELSSDLIARAESTKL